MYFDPNFNLFSIATEPVSGLVAIAGELAYSHVSMRVSELARMLERARLLACTHARELESIVNQGSIIVIHKVLSHFLYKSIGL